MPLWLLLIHSCMYSACVSFRERHHLQLCLFSQLNVSSSVSSLCETFSLQNNFTFWHKTPWTEVLFTLNLSGLRCASVRVWMNDHITPAPSRTVKKLKKSFSLSWPFCWAPSMWRIWGTEGSSLSPSGCIFWLGPSQSRTGQAAPCSSWWLLWLHGPDLPVGETIKWLSVLCCKIRG